MDDIDKAMDQSDELNFNDDDYKIQQELHNPCRTQFDDKPRGRPMQRRDQLDNCDAISCISMVSRYSLRPRNHAKNIDFETRSNLTTIPKENSGHRRDRYQNHTRKNNKAREIVQGKVSCVSNYDREPYLTRQHTRMDLRNNRSVSKISSISKMARKMEDSIRKPKPAPCTQPSAMVG
jgi:hypothetical protein